MTKRINKKRVSWTSTFVKKHNAKEADFNHFVWKPRMPKGVK